MQLAFWRICEICAYHRLISLHFSPPSSTLQIMGLPLGAKKDEIKAAYRKLAVKWHPDKHPEGPAREEASKKFVEIQKVRGGARSRRSKAADVFTRVSGTVLSVLRACCLFRRGGNRPDTLFADRHTGLQQPHDNGRGGNYRSAYSWQALAAGMLPLLRSWGS